MTIAIRHAELSDYEAIRAVMMQPRVVAGTLQLPFPSGELWKKRISELPTSGHLLVAEISGKVVGQLGLHPASESLRRRHAYTLGMAVHDDYQGKGVGSALLRAAIDLADNWLQVKRLELTVYTDNQAALALYRRFGFEIEGTMRACTFRNGVYVDTHFMARLVGLPPSSIETLA